MSLISLPHYFPLEAAATSCMPATKFTACNNDRTPTDAAAQPADWLWNRVWALFERRKTTKLLPGQIQALSWPRTATVVRLFLCRRPANIARFVVTVVVDTVDRMFKRRTGTYISKEGSEAVLPAITDRNASATVIDVPTIALIETTPLHAYPRSILGSTLMLRGCSVCRAAGANSFSGVTAATYRRSLPQTYAGRYSFSSTGTTTSPEGQTTCRPRNFMQGSQAPERLSRKVN